MAMLSFESESAGVRIKVTPGFMDDDSNPHEDHYMWSYRVEIENLRREPVQLLRRTWRITDAAGRTTEVKGDGVVGEQPVIEPGDCFTYMSGAPLTSPFGLMEGAYHMVDEDGAPFDVPVPLFPLDSPHAARSAS